MIGGKGAAVRAGKRVGDRYELTHPIGRGGVGEVWAGRDERLDRPVAIKFLRQLEAENAAREIAVARFMREARAVARLDHLGVPTVHDVGFHDGNIYIVMQLVHGLVLTDLVAERGRVSVSWAAAIGAQISSVLATAHAKAVVHRDLKPQNVMITPTGLVKVLDFGVAALLGADLPRLTVSGEILGTPAYLAPEQALSGTVGPRTDLYALGCLLFELLSGSPPYPAKSAVEIVRRHVSDPVPDFTGRRAGLPDAVTELVTRLLAKNPVDRPETAAAVYQQLIPFAAFDSIGREEPAVVMPDGQSVDPTRPCRYPFGPMPSRSTNVAAPPSEMD